MSDPVNLENLRDMTGGDKALEIELFSVYIQSADDCLKALQENTGGGQEENWRTQAHAWKGMSLNLGAAKLGELCAQAQMAHTATQEEKQALLLAIGEEYQKVKAYLKAL